MPSADVPPVGRTTTSPTVDANSAVKLRFSVSEKIRVPATKATPSTIANVLISRRSLRPRRLFHAALNTSALRFCGVAPTAAVIRVITSITRSRLGSRISSTTLPSARKTTRSVYAAATGSWVTITMVWP